MRHRILFILLFSLLIQASFSQSNINVANFKGQIKVTPPSPNASALGKFGEIPVNLHTGIPEIDAPLYSWKSKRSKIDIKVALDYHAGGIKVEDIASNSGLGWTLCAGGMVTRSVRGLPDDHTFGFINTVPLPDFNTSAYNGATWHNSTTPSQEQAAMNTNRNYIIGPFNTTGTEQTTIKAISDGVWDNEQDIFVYSFDGGKGKFVLDKNGNVQKLDQNNFQITVTYSTTNNSLGVRKTITGFKIVTDEGLIFLFNVPETTYVRSWVNTAHFNYIPSSDDYMDDANALGPPPSMSEGASWDDAIYTSSFHVEKIIDPLSFDTIYFDYSQRTIKYQSGYSESVEYHENNDPLALSYNTGTADLIKSRTSSYQYNRVDGQFLNKIRFSDGGGVDFLYDESRDDLLGDYALTRVEIYDLLGTKKKYKLNYDYYSSYGYVATSGSSSWSLNSEEDYSLTLDHVYKRLKLVSIQQVSSASATDFINSYQFAYNTITLPPRNSKAIDFWGYFLGPDRNSFTLVPKISSTGYPTQNEGAHDGYYNLSSISYNGANRSPHPDYTKAGTLEKITYPTGGFSSFEFETNRTKNNLYYSGYEKNFSLQATIHTTTPQETLILPGRDQSLTRFFILYTRVNADGTPHVEPPWDPNAAHQCFQDAVTSSLITIHVISTDATIHKTASFHGFDQGSRQVWLNFDLPLDKSYKLYFTYNETNFFCLDNVYFKAELLVNYMLTSNSSYVGGLRVKSITNQALTKGTLEKTIYNYNDDLNESTGEIPIIPNYAFHLHSVGMWNGCNSGNIPVFLGYADYRVRNSNSTQTLGYSFGSNCGYTNVEKMQVDPLGNTLGKEIHKYSSVEIRNRMDIFPHQSIQFIDWANGHELEIAIKNKNGSLQKRTLNFYSDVITKIENVNNRSTKIACIRTDNCAGFNTVPYNRYVAFTYYPYNGQSKLIGQRITDFTETDSLPRLITYTYDGYDNLVNINSEDSRARKEQVQVGYPYQFSTVGNNALMAANCLSQEVIKRDFLLKGTPTLFYQTSGNSAEYTVLNNGMVKPTKFYTYGTREPALSSGAINGLAIVQSSKDKLEGEIVAYDLKGNAVEFLSQDGVRTCVIYGYQYSLPIATIVGTTYQDVVSKLTSITFAALQELTDATIIRSKTQEIRQGYISHPNVQVSSFTYSPLNGVNSETDINGLTKYYEYDGFGRLVLIRDNDNNILKKICYNYSGQSETCGASLPSCTSCTGENKKCINGTCETGTKVCTSSSRISQTTWLVTYHYVWSDNSVSQDYQVYQTGGCFQF